MKFELLVNKVCTTLQSELLDVDSDRVARTVRATLKELDLHVDDKGEVYSPVPPPNPLPPPREVGAHWQGSGRGRRGEGGARRRR